ncbi:pectinesterase family protein [Vibrio gangliei]|uniref:pectinesterase family protein n=1 Tax=Vibrio gangliei TaxID=2077090 RepID=UPI0013004FF8|nr:pectinesterase family protein [Vibrio gangliei]
MENERQVVVSPMPLQGHFTSIQQALNSFPDDGQAYQILIKPGVYYERVNVTRDNVHLIGYGQENTIITASCYNQQIQHDGSIPGTYGSRTVCIDAKQCSVSQLTIRNDFKFLENQARPERLRIRHTQSVALLIGNHADCVHCEQVQLESYHDTLFINGGRSYFHRCRISGAIDFIFGAGQAVFTHCDIVARNRTDVKGDHVYGYVTAPSSPKHQPLGFVFLQCKLLKEAGVPQGSYALGRPWHPTSQFYDGQYADPDAIGHCAFVDCLMQDHIFGWDKMSGKGKEGDVVWFYPHESRFEEFNNFIINANQQIENKRILTYSLSDEQHKNLIERVKQCLSPWFQSSYQF